MPTRTDFKKLSVKDGLEKVYEEIAELVTDEMSPDIIALTLNVSYDLSATEEDVEKFIATHNFQKCDFTKNKKEKEKSEAFRGESRTNGQRAKIEQDKVKYIKSLDKFQLVERIDELEILLNRSNRNLNSTNEQCLKIIIGVGIICLTLPTVFFVFV